MKPILTAALAVLALPALAIAAAAPKAPRPFEPENHDALLESATNQPVPGPLSATAAARVDAGRIAHVEERLGVPTFFWAPPPPQQGTSLRQMGLSPEQAARRHLMAFGELYRQPATVLAEHAIVSKVHDRGAGAVIVGFRKEVDGVRVFRDELKVIMNADLELVALSGYLPPHQKVGLRGEAPAFQLSHATAVTTALFDLASVPLESSWLHDAGPVVAGYHRLILPDTLSRQHGVRFLQPARAREVLFTLPGGLAPAYYVELDVELADPNVPVEERADAPGFTRMYSYVVSAVDGRVLFRKNLTQDAGFTYRAWADANGLPWDGPQGTGYSPHPTGTPNGQQTQILPQALITLAHGPISTLDPWLPDGATVTSGNNVDAYADLSSPDGFGAGDIRAKVTSAQTFDFTYNPNLSPRANDAQIQAAVTQLFVDNNFFHDWFYDAGFDEAAGNAQQSNFGRGGIGGDVLRVEAQDFSGTDNANMSTPSDGARPRMQMYVFSGASSEQVTLSTGGNPTGFNTSPATFGPPTFNVTAAPIVADDGNGALADACQPLVNAASVAGKIAIIDRGTCTFVVKVKNAQAAGAVGVVIVNNQAGGAPTLYGNDGTVVIPALSVPSSAGATLKAAAASGTASVTLQRTAAQDRDGTLDNAIVAHEWGHYISNRLIGDANGLNNYQGVGMGEGWGDFHALLVVVREEDALLAGNANFEGVYALSTFVTTGSGGNGLYFGIRRVPYSTDFTRNALTLKHIQNGVRLPQNVPTAFGASGANNAEVHNSGEVWATMLWECYAGLLNDRPRLTFAQAQARMRQYLVAGYKGTPNSPTFLEARDALLAAAYANDPQDFGVMWAAFARRGAGQNAVAPPRASQNNSPVVEDFTAGNQLQFVRATLTDEAQNCDDDGVLDNGETGRLTVTLRNSGTAQLSKTVGTVTSTTPGVTLVGGGQLTFAPSAPFGTTTASIDVTLQGATDIATVEFTITFEDPELDGDPSAPVLVAFRANVEETLAASAIDDVEASTTLWTPGHNTQLDSSRQFKRQALTPAQHVWFGANPESPADVYLVSPLVEVHSDSDFVLTFKQRHDFEFDADTRYDGGVLELRVEGGSWVDIGSRATPAYNGTLAPSPSSNPLRGRPAYTAKNVDHPGFTPTTVNLGREYAGKAVQVRFRIGADDAAAHHGWEIDDIGFAGIVGTPFAKVGPQVSVCGNNGPVADGGPARTVNEGETLTLTATGTDADGDPLTFTWTQTSGEAVAMEAVDATSARFTAPQVTADTVLGFEVVAHDGKQPGAPAPVQVTVKNVNRAPVANLTAPTAAVMGARVSLDGTASFDEDGDVLSYRWVQTLGPAVALEGEGAVVAFAAPAVQENTTLRFELVVNDGTQDSAPAAAEIVIAPSSVSAVGCGGCSAASGPAGAAPLFALLAAVAARGMLRRRRTRR